MINPKNKANSLVDEFRVILMSEDTECGNEVLCSLIAIKHAVIVAREIITDEGSQPNKDNDRIAYWWDVMHEISLL